MKVISRLWVFIAVLIVLSPLGLLLPEHFKSGSAWGEWGPDEMNRLVGYIPEGLDRLSRLWSAPIPDYAFKGWEEKPLLNLSLAYIISAVIGVFVCAGAVFVLGKLISRKE